jgi:hypothetical protein
MSEERRFGGVATHLLHLRRKMHRMHEWAQNSSLSTLFSGANLVHNMQPAYWDLTPARLRSAADDLRAHA